MRIHILTAIVLATGCATLASAQANTPRQAAADGFFRPSPDPSLMAPPPRATPVRPTEALVAEDKVQANAETQTDRAPDPVKVLQWNEQQMDRAEQEAERAKPSPNAPPPVNGSFTGLTDERNR